MEITDGPCEGCRQWFYRGGSVNLYKFSGLAGEVNICEGCIVDFIKGLIVLKFGGQI